VYFLPLFSALGERRLLCDSLHLKEKPGGNGSANRYRDGRQSSLQEIEDLMKKQLLRLQVATLGVCVALFAATVKTDYRHSVNFAQYRTYSWLKVDAGNPLWTDRITRDVDAQLTAKGWMKVPSGGDAAISAFGSTHNQQTLQTFYNGMGGGWFWGGFNDEATTTVENTPVGTLTVDIFDGKSKKLIWRGTASNALSDNSEKNEKEL
jgi:hypothetical protein